MSRDRGPGWALLAILLAAALVRVATLSFGLPALNDQDELMFELGGLRLLRAHTLNPGWFGHPATTTMYVLAVVDAAVFVTGLVLGWFPDPKGFAEAIYHDPTWVILPGRAAIMLFGLLSIVLTERLGRRLFGRGAGLFAAALLAVSPLHISYSQIIRSDMMACAFMLLAMLAALRAADAGRTRDYALSGVWTGIAIATKWPFALSLLAAAGAAAHRRFVSRDRFGTILRALAICGVASIVALFVTSPFLLLDWPTVARNLQGEERPHHLGATGGSFAWNAWWYLTNPLLDAFGPVALLLALVGCVLILRHERARAILLPVIAAFVIAFCLQRLVWPRWALPLLPLLSIGAGAAAMRAAALVERVTGGKGRALALGLVTAAALIPLAFSAYADGRERMNDTRQQASAWLLRHVPPGKTILLEHFAFDLVQTPYNYVWPVGAAGCVDARSLIEGKVSYQTIEKLREGRTNIDYGTVDPARRASCRADYAILSQYDRYAAEARFYPNEYATYRELLSRGRTVALFRPRRGEAGGRVVRIVALRR